MKVIILFAVALLCVNAIKFKQEGKLEGGAGTDGGDPCAAACSNGGKGCDACIPCVQGGVCPDWCEKDCMACAECHGYNGPMGTDGGPMKTDGGDKCEKPCWNDGKGCDACKPCLGDGPCPDWCEKDCMACAECHGYNPNGPMETHDKCEKPCWNEGKGCDACKPCLGDGPCPDWCEKDCMACAVCHGYNPNGPMETHDKCEKPCWNDGKGCDACKPCLGDGPCPDWCEKDCMACAVCHGYNPNGPMGGNPMVAPLEPMVGGEGVVFDPCMFNPCQECKAQKKGTDWKGACDACEVYNCGKKVAGGKGKMLNQEHHKEHHKSHHGKAKMLPVHKKKGKGEHHHGKGKMLNSGNQKGHFGRWN